MTRHCANTSSLRQLWLRSSFTLTELLVVMGVIAVLAGLTAISYRTVAKDAKLSSGKNTVMAVLDNARAMAMKRNKIVVVVFRAQPINQKEQAIEASFAEWTGETYYNPNVGIVDRFRPVANIQSRLLPTDIQVACPQYGGGVDGVWQNCSYFPGIQQFGEQPGAMLGVMFAPDGTVITRNNRTNSHRMFVDFNDDRLQRQLIDNGQLRLCDNLDTVALPGSTADFPDENTCDLGNGSSGTLTQFFCHRHRDDEPYITTAPFLTVYDDKQARDQFDTSTWTNGQNRVGDLTQYISANADRIHFNRYTGVAMK
jgi:prepilin-type N-terminal cleavage/methylation domain-containing protein